MLVQLFDQLLHAVLAAAVHSGRNGLAHGGAVVHFCCGAQADVRRVAPGSPGGSRDPAADLRHVFRDHAHASITFPSSMSSEVRIISSPGQRFPVLD